MNKVKVHLTYFLRRFWEKRRLSFANRKKVVILHRNKFYGAGDGTFKVLFEPASPVKDTQSSVERNANLCDPGYT